MNTKDAMELAAIWFEAHDPKSQADPDLRYPFIQLLENHISGAAETGVGLVDGSPCVLALEGELLIVLSLQRLEDGRLREDVRVIPLTPRPVICFSGLSTGEGHTVPVQNVTRVRTWTIEPHVGDSLSVETSEVLHATFSSDVRADSGEQLMWRVAAQVGWTTHAPTE